MRKSASIATSADISSSTTEINANSISEEKFVKKVQLNVENKVPINGKVSAQGDVGSTSAKVTQNGGGHLKSSEDVISNKTYTAKIKVRFFAATQH